MGGCGISALCPVFTFTRVLVHWPLLIHPCTGPAGAAPMSECAMCVRGGQSSLRADTGHLQGFLSPGGSGFRIAKDHLDCFECRGSRNGVLARV